jgi:NADP-dependent 3-hydroxy acid dehydrogenase YdfG
MLVVQDTGEKAALPQVSAQMMLQVEAQRIGSMNVSPGLAQSLAMLRHQNKVDVIGH